MIVNPSCTSQMPANDQPGLGIFDYSRTICAYGGGPWTGHSNWFPATYTGPVFFEDHSSAWGGDDDYTMDVATPQGRGSLSGNGKGAIHIEFDSDETIDHFRTPFWSDLHYYVDRGEPYTAVHHFLDGLPVVVTGLFGIDWVHTPGAESHPVWAFAVKVNAARYAFFVRNWGNEGLCSSENHTLTLPYDNYTLELPWQPGATDVQITPLIRALILGGLIPVRPLVQFAIVRGVGVFVTFELKPPRLRSLYEGEIRLRWLYRGAHPNPKPRAQRPGCPARVPCESDEPERLAEEMFGPMLSGKQKAAIAARVSQTNTPTRLVGRRAIHIRRASHPPPKPRRRPKAAAAANQQQARRRRRQKSLLCGAVHRAELPAACLSPTSRIGFEDLRAPTDVTNQYTARGVTFGPETSVDTRAPQVATLGMIKANSGVNVLNSGSCFSASCEFGNQSLVTGTFSSPRNQLGMFVGEPVSGAPVILTLTAYDAHDRVLARKQARLEPGSGVHRPIAIVLGGPAARITKFVASSVKPFSLDDLGFA